MKKALCLMLALLMISGGFAALGETSDGTHFEPTLVNAMNRTTVQWAATESNRAWLTLLIALDFMKAIDGDSALSPDLTQPSFVCRDEEGLAVVLHTHDSATCILIVYIPTTGDAMYGPVELNADDDAIEAALESTSAHGCYRNSQSAILQAAADLQSILDG